MGKLRRSLFTLALALIAPKSWAAAAATGVAAGIASKMIGFDPWPWVIGGFGGAIIYVKRPATSRLDAVTNSSISVLIGGLIAPWCAAGVSKYASPDLANDYALAFILSAAWPWLVPVGLDLAKQIKLPWSKSSEG